MLRNISLSASRAATAAAVRAGSRSVSTVGGGDKLGLFNPTDDHLDLRNMIRSFTDAEIAPQAEEFDRDEKFNRPLFNKVAELGLLGITVSEEYGGSGMDATAACIAHEEMSYADPGFTLAYLAHSMLLVNNLSVNGTHEQCLKYLPDLCDGTKIGGMCMSEAGAGTDVLGLTTSATKDGDDYLLNGSKMWITNGATDDSTLGDTFLVYARTGEKASDLSLFIVEKGMEGFNLGQRLKGKCGMRASGTAELTFEDVRVSKENIVGGPEKEHLALFSMMRNLEIERVTLAAMALGIGRRSVDVMVDYGNQRKAFGQPINRFGQIQSHIGTSYAEFMASRSYVYDVANRMDLKSDSGSRVDSDGVKLVATTMGKNVADRAIQTLGGMGYMAEMGVERLWRDSKLLEIGGGTLESHHKNMTKDLAKVGKIQ